MTDDDLHDRLAAAERLRDDAVAATGVLAAVAADLGQDAEVDRLTAAAERIRSARFALMLLGRFNTGKSTLANALLGAAGGNLLPTGDEPTTPMLLSLEYAPEPFVETAAADGTTRRWTVGEFRARLVLDSDEQVNRHRFGDLVSCRIGVPAELLATGVVLYDTAGTADTPDRDAATLDALRQCDAAIVVYSLHSPYGHVEIADEQLARDQHVRVFTVVNTFGKPVGDDKRRHAWNKLVRPRTGVAYDGQDLGREDIFFIDVEPAGHDRGLLAGLEASLGGFLSTHRQAHHIARHTHLARSLAEKLYAEIAAREAGARAGLAAVEAERERLDDELREIADRRDEVIRTIEWAEQDARRQVQLSFDRVIDELQRELPPILLRTVLPSWKRGFAGRAHNLLFRDKLAAELADVAMKRAQHRLDEWAVDTQKIIERRFAAAAVETEESLRALAAAYDEVFERMGAWVPTPTRGWAGMAANLPKIVVTGVLLVGLGLTIAPLIVLPLALITVVVAVVNMQNLVDTYMAAQWIDLKKRLTEYRTQLTARTEEAFSSLRTEAERVINELSLVEAAQTGEARAALAASENEHRERLAELDAYRYRMDRSVTSLGKVLEALDG